MNIKAKLWTLAVSFTSQIMAIAISKSQRCNSSITNDDLHRLVRSCRSKYHIKVSKKDIHVKVARAIHPHVEPPVWSMAASSSRPLKEGFSSKSMEHFSLQLSVGLMQKCTMPRLMFAGTSPLGKSFPSSQATWKKRNMHVLFSCNFVFFSPREVLWCRDCPHQILFVCSRLTHWELKTLSRSTVSTLRAYLLETLNWHFDMLDLTNMSRLSLVILLVKAVIEWFDHYPASGLLPVKYECAQHDLDVTRYS